MSFGEALGWVLVLGACVLYLCTVWSHWPRDTFGAATPWVKSFARAWSYAPIILIGLIVFVVFMGL